MRIPALAAALFALILTACTGAPVPEARPGLWQVSDADTRIWLFGTVHVLPKGYAWRGPALEAAIAGADRLVIEAVMDRDPANASKMIVKLGRGEGLPPLAERVPEGQRKALAALVAKTGLPANGLDGFKTWAAALVLMGATIRDFQMSAADGVEPQLEAAFASAGKPIEGLESAEQQLGYFDALPEADQRSILETLLEPGQDSRKEFDTMIRAWSRGRDKEIAASFDDELKASPAVREALVDRRNAAWAANIAERMKQPGETLIAVGAGHLAGPSAVQTLLARQGFQVTRVQ